MCKCEHPYRIEVIRPSTGESETLLVGCGRCPMCMRKKRYEWSFRIGAEIDKCTDAYFVTLTFDDEHLPNPDKNGRYEWQCFMKRLRKNYPELKGMKYFACSELGSTTLRLHFHVIFMNTRKPWWRFNKCVRDSWQYGKIVDVQDIKNARKCAEYVAKYCYQQIDAAETISVTHRPSGKVFQYNLPKYFRRYVSKGLGLALLSDAYLAYLRSRGDGTYVDSFCGVLPLPSYYIPKVWPKESEEYILIKGRRLEDALDSLARIQNEQQYIYGLNPHPHFIAVERECRKIRKEIDTFDKYGQKDFLQGYPPNLVEFIEHNIESLDPLQLSVDYRFVHRKCRREAAFMRHHFSSSPGGGHGQRREGPLPSQER